MLSRDGPASSFREKARWKITEMDSEDVKDLEEDSVEEEYAAVANVENR